MDDLEVDQDDFSDNVPANKKLTIYVIDGGENMFEGGNDCEFRRALKVVYHQLLKVCCSGSTTHMVGLIITNTVTSKNRCQQKFCYEWIELNLPNAEHAIQLKNMLESDDIHDAFTKQFGGHGVSDLGNVLWSCKKIMALSATTFRHHIIMYLTNNPNPFSADSSSFTRVQRIVSDFCCTSFRDRNGLRKVNKTPGEFHLLMLIEDDMSPEDRTRWESITANIFTGCTDDLDLEAYKKTFTQRAFSNITVELGPGISLGVGVYTLSGETLPPSRVLLDAETETELSKRVFYVPKAVGSEEDDDMDTNVSQGDNKDDVVLDSRAKARSEVMSAVVIGGESITSDREDMKRLMHFDAKGIVLLGFKPISELNLDAHLQPSRFLYPTDDTIRGSTCLYRALLKRCLERKMAMICRFCSRSNQKVRLVALIPETKLKMDNDTDVDEKMKEERETTNHYRQNGFHVVFLPYNEDIRDVTEKLQCPNGEWPEVGDDDVSASRRFIKNLTKVYTPENFFNPRLRSLNSMLIEAAVGDTVDREDSILPYHKTRSAGFVEKLTSPFIGHFRLAPDSLPEAGSASKRTGDTDRGTPKRSKKDDLAAMTTEEMAKKGLLNKLTVAELRAALAQNAVAVDSKAKKADLVSALERHFGVDA